MVSIYVFRRRRGKNQQEKIYTAQIRFGRKHQFLRSTGKTSEREALAEAKRIAKKIEKEELPRLGKPVLSLDAMFGRWWVEYAHRMRSAKIMEYTVETLLKHLGRDKPVDLLSDSDINDFVQKRTLEGVTGSTINRHLTILRGAIRYGRRWGLEAPSIEWRDHFQREPKEREIFISPSDASALMALMPVHVGLAFAWSIYTGCRLNETRTLTFDRIHIESRFCMVQAKGGHSRKVWLSDKARQVLALAIEQRREAIARDAACPVFNLTNRRRHWEAAKAEMKRPELRWHDLRHVTASWARQYSGSDLKLIGRALGHSNIETTSRYSHVLDTEILSALDKLPDIGLPDSPAPKKSAADLAAAQERL